MNYLLSLVSGIIISLMISINGELTSYVGMYAAAVIIHIVGVVFSLILCKVKNYKIKLKDNGPLWCYLGGAIGVISTFGNNFAFGKISLTSIVALGLFGQTVTSIVIDCFGLLGMKKCPFKKTALPGLICALAGIYIMLDSSIGTAAYAVVFSIFTGVTVVLSRTITAQLAKNAGMIQASFINHLVGLPFTVLILMFTFKKAAINPIPPEKIWVITGGMLGVLVVMTFNYIVPRVSSFYLTLLNFIGQVFAGILIDIIVLDSYSDLTFKAGLFVAAGMLANILLEYKITNKKEAVA